MTGQSTLVVLSSLLSAEQYSDVALDSYLDLTSRSRRIFQPAVRGSNVV